MKRAEIAKWRTEFFRRIVGQVEAMDQRPPGTKFDYSGLNALCALHQAAHIEFLHTEDEATVPMILAHVDEAFQRISNFLQSNGSTLKDIQVAQAMLRDVLVKGGGA